MQCALTVINPCLTSLSLSFGVAAPTSPPIDPITHIIFAGRHGRDSNPCFWYKSNITEGAATFDLNSAEKWGLSENKADASTERNDGEVDVYNDVSAPGSDILARPLPVEYMNPVAVSRKLEERDEGAPLCDLFRRLRPHFSSC